MSSTSPYIQCGLCGHRHPTDHLRRRGYIDCSCGMRLEAGPEQKRHHRLARTIVGLVIIAAIGGAYLLARGLG